MPGSVHTSGAETHGAGSLPSRPYPGANRVLQYPPGSSSLQGLLEALLEAAVWPLLLRMEGGLAQGSTCPTLPGLSQCLVCAGSWVSLFKVPCACGMFGHLLMVGQWLHLTLWQLHCPESQTQHMDNTD